MNEPVALRVERAATGFGKVSRTGEVDAAVSGVTSIADDAGAYYVREDAIRVTVSSGGPWVGECHAGENQGSAATILVGDGRLSWRETGTSEWTPFTTDPSSRCFPAPRVGADAYRFDLRLRVERSDPPGTFVSTINFSVSPERPSS